MANKTSFKILNGFLFIFLLIGCAAKLSNVKADQFNKLRVQDDIELLDVRTKEEYDAGHIKNAKNINVQDSSFRSEIDKLDKTKTILVYCRSGKRSTAAVETLKEAGFNKIINLEGGILSWEESALPINK